MDSEQTKTCKCGCGETPNPERLYLMGHQNKKPHVACTCEFCGKVRFLKPSHGKQKYCSHRCREKARGVFVARNTTLREQAAAKPKNFCLCGCGKVTKNRKSKWFLNHWPRSDAYRIKQSATQSGRTLSDEHRAKVSAAGKGRIFSDEHRLRIGAALLGKTRSEETRHKVRQARSRQIFPVKDTKLEKAIQTFLDLRKVEYLKHKILSFLHPHHQFDLVLPTLKIAIEAQGCYWHACGEHFPKNIRRSKFDTLLPELKLKAADLGWRLLEIWEHDVTAGDFTTLTDAIDRPFLRMVK